MVFRQPASSASPFFNIFERLSSDELQILRCTLKPYKEAYQTAVLQTELVNPLALLLPTSSKTRTAIDQ
jgi:hypothetical protein